MLSDIVHKPPDVHSCLFCAVIIIIIVNIILYVAFKSSIVLTLTCIKVEETRALDGRRYR